MVGRGLILMVDKSKRDRESEMDRERESERERAEYKSTIELCKRVSRQIDSD